MRASGELGDNLYVVESGSFNVFVNSKQVATRGKGTCFGQSRDMRDRMWQLRRRCCHYLGAHVRTAGSGCSVCCCRFLWLISATVATLVPAIRTAVFQASLH